MLTEVYFSSPNTDATVVQQAQEREQQDALAGLHDALRNPLWWPLEFFPLMQTYQDEEGKWHRSFRSVTFPGLALVPPTNQFATYRWNVFRPRHARKTLGVVKVHSSVKYRQENSSYVPRARLDGEIVYVD